MASSASAVRRQIRALEEGLQLFTGSLAQEAHELRRNVENQPKTGATYYRNILEDLHQRLEGIGQELQALEGVSGVGAISLAELVGHSVALYCHNHQQIQELEATLTQYGYRDLYAPLPPENPLDMLELHPAPGGARAAAGTAAPDGLDCNAEEADNYAAAYGERPCGGEAADGSGNAGAEALGEVTNRLAAAYLAASPQQAHMAGMAAGQAAAGAPPRTTLKAMAPMTAAKALMQRADTPSTALTSPEALSPSMRELLGKYAASSSCGTQPHLSAAPPSSAGTPRSMVGGTPPPAPAYLSPAFQLAAMEQEMQMAHAEAAAVAGQHGGGGGADDAQLAPWEADDAMYSALTATARKLAGKPSFMEAYRQRFPAIMASTERLLQTVEKQRRPVAAAAVAREEAAGGPVAALAAAAMAAAAQQQQQEQGAGHQQQQQQHDAVAAAAAAAGQVGIGEVRRRYTDEESTMDLMSQVLRRRAVEEPTEDIGRAAAAASSTLFRVQQQQLVEQEPAAAGADALPPSTAVLLSRALSSSSGSSASVLGPGVLGSAAAPHPISSLRADPVPCSAAAPQAGAVGAAVPAAMQSAPRSELSKPQLEEAIAAALRRRTTAAVVPTSATTGAAAGAVFAAAPLGTAPVPAEAGAAAARSLPAAPPAAPEVVAPPVAPAAARPPAPPPAAVAAAAAGPGPAPISVPPLRPVTAEEFTALPTFIKSQLPLEALNATLSAVHAVADARGSGFTMDDVEAAGLGSKCKVVVNSLVKLGRAQLKVTQQGTIYLLV